MLILEHGRRVAGAAVMLWRKNSPTARLYDIVVEPQFQGRGFGSRLLRACETEAVGRGYTAISLEVRTSNRRAVALYRNHGYDIAESLPGYYDGGASGLRMVKKLLK